MPPSSTRRVGLRNRRDPDPQPSDAETPESIATPSRKRRRLNGTERPADDAPRTRITESLGSNDSNATLPNGADGEGPSDPVERQNLIIASLRTPPNYTPNAAIDYANDLQARRTNGDVAAYAKIAARDWCFFVKKTTLLIGRVDSSLRTQPPVADPSGPPQTMDMAATWGVDIDLGPERQISRVHAQIAFDSADQTWYITVNSRNGLKLDDTTVPKGSRVALHSGVCIGIMGTQMLFLLASQPDRFHTMLWRQVRNDPDEEADSDKDDQPPQRSLSHAHPGAPTPKRDTYDPFPPSSHPRHKQSSQAFSHQFTSTPGRPMPGTPMGLHSSGKRGSPAYPRGIMMETGEEIDYSLDLNKDIKPPHSYAQLIGQAILSSPEEMLTLANIYQFIRDKYAFFRHTNAGWQNSIRHNLSLSKCFQKVARRTDEPGKGMKWKIVDAEKDDFVKKQLLNPRKGGGPVRLDSSGPSSPAINNPPLQATERLMGALAQSDVFGRSDPPPARIKSPPRSATPPMTSYPMANESYTPDRGPRPPPFASFKQSPTHGEHATFATPAKKLFHDNHLREAAPFRQSSDAIDNRQTDIPPSSPNGDAAKPNVVGLREHLATSPPPLYSDPAANGPNGAARGLVTPLVSRHQPRLVPPSTAHVPSQYMNFSSPAPFWKFVDLPSTPAKQPLDLSPIKMKREREDDEKEVEDENEMETEPVQPSSPPIIDHDRDQEDDEDDEDNEGENGEGNDQNEDQDHDMTPDSPTRTLSRPVSRAHLPPPGHQRSREPSAGKVQNIVSANAAHAANGGMVRGASLKRGFEEEEEEGGFDLAKGFQKIGTFHRSLQSHGIPPPPTTNARNVGMNMSHGIPPPAPTANARSVGMNI